ncbi:MAG: hypothetical protein ACR2ND_09335 [Solirubrobacteraceae bacterium]
MSSVAHHVVWALAVLALAQAALRVASLIAPSGLERVIATAVIGVAAAVIAALALGLAGLGASTIALAAATAVSWLLARMLLPAHEISPWIELQRWWCRIGDPARIAAAALTGVFLAWVAWQLRHPAIGYDSSLYHYPDVAGWIVNGRPGSALRLSYDIPYGNYPMTDEVALTWGAGLARSWLPLALWEPGLTVLMAAGTWLTLRQLSVPRVAAGIATAAMVATPLVVHQLNEPETDLPGLAWLACTGALALGARRRPALLAVALIAAGLAIGTKTSTAPLALAGVAVGLFLTRGRLRPLSRCLVLGLAVALIVGGIWYVRNLVQHGSPLWPFTATPWGTPKPRFFALVNKTFLQRPIATLDGRLGGYTSRLGGGWLLVVAVPLVLVCGAVARRWRPCLRRQLILAAAVSLAAFLAWSLAWGTGLPTTRGVPGSNGWPISSIRYMLPVVFVSTSSVALLTRAPRPIDLLATFLLLVALLWSLVADARLGLPYTPSARVVVGGALAGVGAWAVAAVVTRRQAVLRAGRVRSLAWPVHLVPWGVVTLLVTVAIGASLSPVSDGFLARYSKLTRSTAPGGDVAAWLWQQPGFQNSSMPVAFASRAVLGTLAGDHFTHKLILVPAGARCDQVIALAHRMPIVVTGHDFFYGILGLASYDAPSCLGGVRPAYQAGAYRVYWLRAVR